MGSFERTNDELLRLRTERLLSDIRVCLQDLEFRVTPFGDEDTGGKLEGERRGGCPEIAPVRKVSRAEEVGPELSVCKARLGGRLCNGRFLRPSQAVQPENTLTPFGY